MQPILDSVSVDGTVEAVTFIGSGSELTGVPQTLTLDGFDAGSGGTVVETDTIQSAIQKIEYKVNNISIHGNGDLSLVFTQSTPSTSWVIVHNLGKYPVVVVDDGTTVIIGDINYENMNQLTINFTTPFSGRAFLN